jgi:hypothetical protein
VSPSFTYTTSVKNIGLQETTVSAATKVNVTGWQTTAVRRYTILSIVWGSNPC